MGLTLSPGAVDVELEWAAWLVVMVDDVVLEDKFDIAVDDAIDGKTDGNTSATQFVVKTTPARDVLFTDKLGSLYVYPPDISGISVNVSYCIAVVIDIVCVLL